MYEACRISISLNSQCYPDAINAERRVAFLFLFLSLYKSQPMTHKHQTLGLRQMPLLYVIIRKPRVRIRWCIPLRTKNKALLS